METLRKFYKTNLTRFTFLSGLALFFVKSVTPWLVNTLTPITQNFVPSATNDQLSNIFNFIVAAALTGILIFGERFIRKQLWRLNILGFFHPDLDLSGVWLGRTYYQELVIEGNNFHEADFQKMKNKMNSGVQHIDISQDAINISLLPSPAKYFIWESLAIDLSEEKDGKSKRLTIAYDVKYSGGENEYPDEAKGIEEMRVVQFSNDGYPISMQGTFRHIAKKNGPCYRGVTVYIRPKRTDEIDVDKLFKAKPDEDLIKDLRDAYPKEF